MKRKGFTLIELIVAMIIVTILASIVTPQLLKSAEKSRQAEAVAMLMRMYKGYKILIVDEVINSAGNFINSTPFDMFNPDETNTHPPYPSGRSLVGWQALGFTNNTNMQFDTLYFSYDFYKANEGQEYVFYQSGRIGGNYRPLPLGITVNDVIGVAWRKTSRTRELNYGYFPIDSNKWLLINMNNGKIYKSSHYQ